MVQTEEIYAPRGDYASRLGSSQERRSAIAILDEQGRAAAGIRRAVLDGARRAVEALRDGGDRPDGVHEARKRIKEQRAALRLGREAMGERAYRRDDHALRDAARSLGNARDAHVVAETLEATLQTIASLDPEVAESARRRAAAEFPTVSAGLEDRAAATLEAMADHALGWRLDAVDEAVVTRAVRGSWRKARRSFRRALRDPAPTRLHRWRKRVKTLFHQAGLVEGLFPELDSRSGELHDLADRLGSLHDLAVLRRALTGDAADGPPPLTVLAAIEARERILRDDVLARGSALFDRKAKCVVNRSRKDHEVAAPAAE